MMVATLPPGKLWRTLISATLFSLAFFINLRAQAYTDDKGTTPVTVTGTAIRLEKVFKSIEKQTGLRFNYRSDLLNINEKVTVNYQNKPLDEILAALLQPRGFVWKYMGSAITLQPAEKEAPVADTLITFSGRVLNDEGTPLPGATVKVKGTSFGTASSSDGGYSLKASGNSTLVISYTGYRSQEVRAARMAMIKLEKAINDMSEQVVVAYGTTTARSNVGAVTVIKGEQIQTLPNRSFDKSLQGLVPGLLVTNGTGQPGGGVSNMVLRGISSGSDGLYGSTARNPLIVIDGVPVTQDHMQYNIMSYATPLTNPLAQLNPNDIASISVLKDAAAISLYGSKASNGVMLITTKRGKKGATSISFSHQTDISFRPKERVKMLNQQEYLDLLYESYRNADAGYWTDQRIRSDLYDKFPYIVKGTDTSFYPQANWFDAVYEDAAPTISNNLSVAGGTEKAAFYVNAEHSKQKGIVKASGYERSSLRLNFDLRPTPYIKVSNSTSLSYNKQDISNPSEAGNSFGAAANMSPLNPIRDTDGKYVLNFLSTYPPTPNPAAAIEYNKNKLKTYRGISTFKGEIRFLKDFSLSSTLGADFMLSEHYEKSDPRLQQIEGGYGNGRISEYQVRRANLINTNLLSYDKKIDQHHLNLLVGQEAQIITQKATYLQANGSSESDPYYDAVNSPGYTLASYYLNNSKQTLLSQLGQLQYAFKERYMLSGSLRRDGSSLFGTKQQWANYWSTGAGWILSEEAFMRPLSPYISYLKLRGSLGISGNSSNVNNLTRYERITTGTLDGEQALFPDSYAANSNIKWEQTYSWNAGVDISLLSDRISMTIDAYKKNTQNLIYATKLASITGHTNTYENIGDLSNKGIEASISATPVLTPNFKWRFRINWSTNKNVLTKAYISLEQITSTELSNEVGRNYNSFYLPVWLGVNTEDGQPQWLDTTGKPNSNYYAAQRKFVGKPQPDGFANMTNTISWKGFDLAFQLYYQYGFQVLNNIDMNLINSGSYPYQNQSKDALKHWKKAGDVSPNPKVFLNNFNPGTNPSTRYLQDGSYLSLQQVQVTYNFPRKLTYKIKSSSVRVFLQSFNVAQWSLVKNINPDNSNVTGVVGTSYPQVRSFSAGLNITL